MLSKSNRADREKSLAVRSIYLVRAGAAQFIKFVVVQLGACGDLDLSHRTVRFNQAILLAYLKSEYSYGCDRIAPAP